MDSTTSTSPSFVAPRKAVPRGIAEDGLPILSYGFRPFFLLAGVFGLLAMMAWIAALTIGWDIGGAYGMLNWHAHEMLFGYTSAALAGFMLTSIPNWTGRLPVSGVPLLLLVCLWVAGRVAMLAPDAIGIIAPVAIDLCFLPVLAIVAGREIIAGRNWKNLKILLPVMGLALANLGFHASVLTAGEAIAASRAALGLYLMLIALIGGRIIPSFTRNWLVKAGSTNLPAPFGRFDLIAIIALGAACVAWVVVDETIAAAALAFAAAALNAIRLVRWKGWQTIEEPLLVVLHVGYAFLPLGMLCVGLAELGLLSAASALHVCTVGGIGIMTFAVMTRASLGHTGRPLRASATIAVAYLALTLAATVRPFAELLPQAYHLLLEAAGACWMLAFALFLVEYAPILWNRRHTGVPATPAHR